MQKTLEKCAFHEDLPWVELPLSMRIPDLPHRLTPEERWRVELAILECREVNADANLTAAPSRSRTPRNLEEQVRQAWERFFLCHFTFFYDFAFLTDCYTTILDSLESGRWEDLERSVDRACVLWRSAGAIMLYGVDFTPTEEIYNKYIRPIMPEGLSGTWLREFWALDRERKTWARAAAEVGDLQRVAHSGMLLDRAERVYQQLHFKVMKACVPDMQSKLQKYVMDYGPFNLEEKHLRIFDDWFHVVRSPAMGFSRYIESGCDVLSKMVRDISLGTGLEATTLSFIFEGVSTMLEMMLERLHTQATDDKPSEAIDVHIS